MRRGLDDDRVRAASVQAFTAALRQAVTDGLDRDRRGLAGRAVGGIDELATELRAALATAYQAGPTAAWRRRRMYWIASQVPLTVTPSGEVGSIGVIAEHWDESRAIDTAGLVDGAVGWEVQDRGIAVWAA